MSIIPDAKPEQNPIPKPRSDNFVLGYGMSRHAVERAIERKYDEKQIYQTIREGHRRSDPKGNPRVSVFELNSIDTPGTRRSIVTYDAEPNTVVTVNPRQPLPPPREKQPPKKSTKKLQAEQKAKKRARSAQ